MICFGGATDSQILTLKLY